MALALLTTLEKACTISDDARRLIPGLQINFSYYLPDK